MKTNTTALDLLFLASLFVVMAVIPCCDGFAPLQQTTSASWKNTNNAAASMLLPQPQPQPLQQTSKIMEEITHELEELGNEIKPQLRRSNKNNKKNQPHGFDEYQESLVHKLRQAIHEKDVVYHQALEALEEHEKRETSMELLLDTLQDIQKHLATSKEYAIAYGTSTTAKELRHNQDLHDLVQTLERIEKDITESKAYALAWETAEVELYREQHQHRDNDDNKQQDHHDDESSVRQLLWKAMKLPFRRVKNGVKGLFSRKKASD